MVGVNALATIPGAVARVRPLVAAPPFADEEILIAPVIGKGRPGAHKHPTATTYLANAA